MLKLEINVKKGLGEVFSGKLFYCIIDWCGIRYRDRGLGLLLFVLEIVRYFYFFWDWVIVFFLELDVC